MAVELKRKLTILADAAKYDASCASSGAKGRSGPGLGNTSSGICHSYTPDGRCVSLLKILLTNACVFDCLYCINRSSSDVPRARFTPPEIVSLTLQMYRRNYIEGLFLSSGVFRSPDYTMAQMIEVARSLREDHGFAGYIHLKTVAGASDQAVEDAGRYADRLSCNVELPTPDDLARLAPEKRSGDIDQAMKVTRHHIDRARAERPRRSSTATRRVTPVRFAPAGQSTQMIVGATPTPDLHVLRTASRLYDQHRLRRVYYSAYSPITHADAALPAKPPALIREHRLYQADWLFRFYGFQVGELVDEAQPDLPLDIDPKLAWALRHRGLFPVDPMRADRSLLLRVPGLGTRSVQAILAARRHRRLTLDDLRRLRVSVRTVAPFLDLPGSHAGRWLDRLALRERMRAPEQLALFDAGVSASSGQL